MMAGIGALVASAGLIVAAVLGTRSTSGLPPAAAPAAVDRRAPPSLVQAANAVGFHPTTEAGVGELERRPASAADPPMNQNFLAIGTRAPAFTLKTPQGKKVSLSDFRGKAVLLEFFATWCRHCNAEAPHLRDLYASLPKKSYGFIAVNADGEDRGSVSAFHRYFGLQYPALVDPGPRPGSFNQEGAAGPVTSEYRADDFPTFYVLDRAGRIAWRSDGEQPDALLRAELRKAAARA
jgi:peroxiredoxin